MIWVLYIGGSVLLVLLIFAGLTRCPHCGRWHANREAEIACRIKAMERERFTNDQS